MSATGFEPKAYRFADPRYALVVTVVIVAALIAQISPHPWNFAPLGALALFSGAYLPRIWALGAPLAVLLTAQLFTIGLYEPLVMAGVYAGFAASALAGRLLLFTRKTPLRFALGVGAGALAFYAISNFPVWVVYAQPHTVTTLVETYVRGLPFLARSLAADTAYALVFFTIAETAARAFHLPQAPLAPRPA